ncbi:glycosyltransferase [Novosphingobium sp.]|uniref:glycosyltransferase n=1 Tax=Novosphingobium sp. TaxID=1874826 RepID=UPI003D117D71
MTHQAWAIAIPAHDEADRIGACLTAIAGQRDIEPEDGTVLVLANNCSDDTARIARGFAHVDVIEHRFDPGAGSAGAARRLAMAQARELVRDDGVLLTTDADTVPDPDWVATMLAAFSDNRVDLVAGRVSANWDEMQHHPAMALEIGALEWRYCNLLPLIEDAIDPLPHNPAPRHAQQCGANIGIRAGMFDAIGGVPDVAVGEDRALIEAVLSRDGGVRHATAPHVVASARIDGRAQGGMATALRDRIAGTYLCDELVIPAALLERRLVLRRQARCAFAKGEFAAWAASHGVSASAEHVFGAAWAKFLARNSELAAQPLRPCDLPDEIARIEHLLATHDVRDVA